MHVNRFLFVLLWRENGNDYSMTLHIFNPEHDIALASGLSNFTAPHAGRQLRHDLGWLPLLWASVDDCVLTDTPKGALHSWQRLCGKLSVEQADKRKQLSAWRSNEPLQPDSVACWGWDAALCAALRRRGVADRLLPTTQQTDTIRRLSHRHTSAWLLPLLQTEGTVGQAWECFSEEEATARIAGISGRAVLKAPWSSSGRGLRFVDCSEPMLPNVTAWLRNVVSTQGSVMVEPYYNKVKDFGMEFSVRADGSIAYEGLSLFSTKNGAYTGNLLATERHKRLLMSRYLPTELLDDVAQHIALQIEQLLAEANIQSWVDAFGVDMMVVGAEQQSTFLLHPCVEVNLRRTMGHAAIALTRLVNPRDDDEVVRVMRISLEDNQYKLKIERL